MAANNTANFYGGTRTKKKNEENKDEVLQPEDVDVDYLRWRTSVPSGCQDSHDQLSGKLSLSL